MSIDSLIEAAGDPDGVKADAITDEGYDAQADPNGKPADNTDTNGTGADEQAPASDTNASTDDSRSPSEEEKELFGDLMPADQDDEPEPTDENEEEGDPDDLEDDSEETEDTTSEADQRLLEEISSQANANFETAEQVAEEFRRLQTENQGAQQYVNLLQQDEQLSTLIKTYLESDGDLTKAVTSTIPTLTSTEPDRYEDPEAWAEWKLEQERKAQQQEQQTEKQRRQQQIQKQIADSADKAWEAFTERRGLDDAEAKKLARKISKLTQGDLETGELAPAMFERLAFAANYEQEKQRLRDQIEKEVRREVASELKQNGTLKTTDGLPWNSGASTGPGKAPQADQADRLLSSNSSSRGFNHGAF